MSDLQERVQRTADCFRQAAAARGMYITADERINEEDAAELIGYAHGTLRNMRTLGGGPSFFSRPLGGFSKSYRLEDLAAWVERSRQDTI